MTDYDKNKMQTNRYGVVQDVVVNGFTAD